MEFVAAFILALLISILFAVRNRDGATMMQLVIFFFILFMAGLAGQYWITPFGPVWRGVAWVPLLFILLIVTLLFAAPLPGYHHRRRSAAKVEENPSAIVAVSIFIWLLLLVLLIAVLIGYSRRSDNPSILPEREKITGMSYLSFKHQV